MLKELGEVPTAGLCQAPRNDERRAGFGILLLKR
jgi:hypothetical protein